MEGGEKRGEREGGEKRGGKVKKRKEVERVSTKQIGFTEKHVHPHVHVHVYSKPILCGFLTQT